MKTLTLFKKISLLILFVAGSIYNTAIAQEKGSNRNHYELTLKAADNSKINVEVVVMKNGKKRTDNYVTPVCIKYTYEDMTVFVKSQAVNTPVDFKMCNINASRQQLNHASTTFPFARFELSNGSMSVSKAE